MSSAFKIWQGSFGRVALLDMDKPLVPHAHHHCHVLLKASGADTFFNVRNRLQPLTDDSAVLVNAWEPHSYTHHGVDAPRTQILALYIEPRWLANIQQMLRASAHPRFFPQPCVALPPAARQMVAAITQDMLVAQTLPAELVEERVFDLLIAIIEHNSEWRNYDDLLRTLRSQSSDARIRRALAVMQANVGNPIDVDRLAAECGLSRSHFFALFRQSTQLTPAVYANVLRMEATIGELGRATTSVSDVAYRLGFSAPGHLTRFFREHLGITPSEYRRVVDFYYDGTAAAPAAASPAPARAAA